MTQLVKHLVHHEVEAALLDLVYAEVALEAVRPLAARSLRAGLDKLAEEGRAQQTGAGWRRSP